MQYSTNSMDTAIGRKARAKRSIRTQIKTNKLRFGLYLKDGFCFKFLQRIRNNSLVMLY